jgi:membrane-anchored protein YejM (alkaline phosphatase superfamily)
MNPPWSQTDLVLLSNAFRLLAVVTLLFAAMGIAVLAALIFAEWSDAVRESEARRRQHRPTSPRRPLMLHVNEVNT